MSTNLSKVSTHETEAIATTNDNFESWIAVTKKKLKEREIELMDARISTLQKIVNVACQSFEKLNSLNHSTQRVSVADYDKVIRNCLVHECLDKLHLTLSLWNGVNLRKTKQVPSTFRKYFLIGKSWFDQKKKNILSPDFWIKFFLDLEKFVNEAAAKFFNRRFLQLQRLYSKALLFRIVSHIFSGEIHYSATKVQPLIAYGVVKNEESMKQYLLKLHNTLNIQQFIVNHSSSSQNIAAKDLHQLLRKQLRCLTDQYHIEFRAAFQQLWSDAIGNWTENETTDVAHHAAIYSKPAVPQPKPLSSKLSNISMYRFPLNHAISRSQQHVQINSHNNNINGFNPSVQQSVHMPPLQAPTNNMYINNERTTNSNNEQSNNFSSNMMHNALRSVSIKGTSNAYSNCNQYMHHHHDVAHHCNYNNQCNDYRPHAHETAPPLNGNYNPVQQHAPRVINYGGIHSQPQQSVTSQRFNPIQRFNSMPLCDK